MVCQVGYRAHAAVYSWSWWPTFECVQRDKMTSNGIKWAWLYIYDVNLLSAMKNRIVFEDLTHFSQAPATWSTEDPTGRTDVASQLMASPKCWSVVLEDVWTHDVSIHDFDVYAIYQWFKALLVFFFFGGVSYIAGVSFQGRPWSCSQRWESGDRELLVAAPTPTGLWRKVSENGQGPSLLGNGQRMCS